MKNINNKIAIAYCRSATMNQSGCANTLIQQQEKCLQKAKNDGHSKVKVITEVASGDSLMRKGMQALIKLVKQNRVDSVYVVDTERLSRNSMDFFSLKKLFDKYGVELKAVDQPSAEQGFIESITTSLQEYERKMRSVRIKIGLERRRELLKSTK